MAGKNFTVSFNITGAMDGNLLSSLRTAANAMRGLGESARAASAATKNFPAGLAGVAQALGSLRDAANKFRDLKRAAAESQRALSAAQTDANKLAAQSRKDAQAVDQLRQKLSQLHAQQSKLAQNQNQNRGLLKLLRDQRAEIKAKLKELGAAGRKIPRELLGTAKGNQIGQLLTRLTDNKAALEAQRQKFRETTQSYKELADSIKRTKAGLKSAESAASQSGRGFEQAKANAASLKSSLQQQQAALQQLRSQLGAAGFSTSNFVSSERQLQAEVDRVNAALRQQQALLQARQNFNSSATNLAVSGAGMMGAMYTAEQIAQPFKSATEKAIEFERVMSEVKALTQMDNIKAGNFARVEREMKQLTAQAKELGATTIYTAQEVGEAQAYIARTGWATNQILGATPIFLKLAASQHMDIARTADIATNIMTAFGHNMAAVGNDADKFAQMIQHDADVFAYTVTHSNQTFEQFGEAMKYAAPVAKNFGATIEEAAMMTKFMGDAGIQGSMAGTSMRQTMLRLIAPPKKATKAMEQYGITLDDANAAWQNANAVAQEYGVTLEENLTPGRQFISVMEQIDKNMAGASNREKLAALSAITGINAVSGAANLFGAGANQARNFTELLEQCDGALKQTYKVMTDNTFGAQKSFESAWEAVQLSVGESLNGIARYGYEKFAPMLTGLSQFIDAHPQVVQAAAAIAGALATIVVGAAAVKLAFAGWGFITSTIALVSTALTGLGSGALLGGLIGRLAALRAALFGLGGAATFGGWGAMFGAISTQAAAAATAIRGFFASLTLGSMASGIASGITAIGTALRGAAVAAMSFAFSPVGVALMALALAGMYCYQNWEKVAPVLSNIAGIVTGSITPAIQAALPAVRQFIDILAQAGQSSALKELVTTVGGTLVKAFVVLATVAATAISTVIRGLGDLVKTVADLGTGLTEAFYKFSEGDFSGAADKISATASATMENIRQMGSHAWTGFENGARRAGEAVDLLDGKITATQMKALHQAPSSMPQFDDPMMNAAQVAPPPAQIPTVPEVPPIDTAQAQGNLDALGASAQTASTNMDGVNLATQNLTQAGTDVQTLATNAQTAGTNVQTLATNAQQAGTAMQQVPGQIDTFNAALLTPQDNLAALGDAAGNSVENISAMSDAAGAVASALSSKAVEIGNIHISVPTVSVGGAVAANYEGGIYRKGAFMTTFAEKSPEAAIPLDNSQRAKDLWTQAGQMLGMLPQTQGIIFETTPPYLPEEKFPRGKEIPGRRRAPRRTTQIPQIPSDAMRVTQTTPQYYDAIRLAGDMRNGIITPQIMMPREENSGGLIGDLVGKIIPRQQPAEQSSPTINITLNVYVDGNANAEEVKRGVEESIPPLRRSLREELNIEMRERRRRSFA